MATTTAPTTFRTSSPAARAHALVARVAMEAGCPDKSQAKFGGAYAFKQRLDAVCRWSGYGDLPVAYDQAAYGFAWACQTGRVGVQVWRAMERMSVASLSNLLGEFIARSQPMGEAARFLNEVLLPE